MRPGPCSTDARALVATSHDVRASFTLRLAESALEYVDGRFGPARELVTAAYRDGIFAGDDQRLRLAHMWHGEVLSVLDRDDEAFAIAADGLAAAQRDRQGWAYRMFEVWHGRMLLRVGRLSEAAAVLEGRFDMEDGSHAAAVLDAAGIVALGKLAIHTGDRRQLRRLTDIAQRHVRTRNAGGAKARRMGARPGRIGRRPRRGCAPLVARAGRGERGHPAAVPARCRRRGAAGADRAGRA